MPIYLLAKSKGQQFESPGHYTAHDREKIKKETPQDFAGPGTSFPVKTAHDVQDAARLAGKARNPSAVRSRIKAIAKRKGFPLPASWRKSEKPGDA